jgi:hypothetical protein
MIFLDIYIPNFEKYNLLWKHLLPIIKYLCNSYECQKLIFQYDALTLGYIDFKNMGALTR